MCRMILVKVDNDLNLKTWFIGKYTNDDKFQVFRKLRKKYFKLREDAERNKLC